MAPQGHFLTPDHNFFQAYKLVRKYFGADLSSVAIIKALKGPVKTGMANSTFHKKIGLTKL